MAAQAKPADATKRNASHGRGGAGNINTQPANGGTSPVDLETPTLKSTNYTTGRGGTGNIVPNDKGNPSAARAAQDVDTPAAHGKEAKGTYHWGRGGQGNMMTLGDKQRTSSKGEGERGRRPSFGGVVEKGKSFLGIGKRDGEEKKSASPPESATVVDETR